MAIHELSDTMARTLYRGLMLIMERLKTVTAQLDWNRQQRDKLIGLARRQYGFTRKEVAAVTGLSERQITRIADNYDGSAPSNAYYPPNGTDEGDQQ